MNSLTPRFGALLLNPEGGRVTGFQPYGATATTDTSKYFLDAIVMTPAPGNDYYDDVLIARDPEVGELCDNLGEPTKRPAPALQNRVAELVSKHLQGQHVDAATDLKAEYQPADFQPQRYFQENAEGFTGLQASIVNDLKTGFAAVQPNPFTGAKELKISPFELE